MCRLCPILVIPIPTLHPALGILPHDVYGRPGPVSRWAYLMLLSLTMNGVPQDGLQELAHFRANINNNSKDWIFPFSNT